MISVAYPATGLALNSARISVTFINVEKQEHVAILTLNRPDSLNALGAPGDGALIERVCEDINSDPALRCVVMTGAGKAFSAGGDIRAMKERTGAFSGSAIDIRESYRKNIHKIVRAIHGLEIPCIAAVNGPAIGLGCDIACMADIRIAADTAKFGVTFLRLGLVPGDGGAWLLPRIIGMSRAAELLYSAELIDAPTALDWGLVNRLTSPEDLMQSALKLARRISEQSPHALRLGKTLLRQGQMASFDAILEMSAGAQAIAHLTDDHMEGVNALLERRTPRFSGK